MVSYSIDEMIHLIEKGKTFEAVTPEHSFRIKIEEYIPFVCTAIHNGNNLRESLKDKCLLDDAERWYEEDPDTGLFITSFPIVLIGVDSRYEYDLNRQPDEAIYDIAWGKKVWKEELSDTEKSISLQKHVRFYRVVHALINKLETLFQGCVVYDIHSYNYQRYNRYLPLFNIGIDKIDKVRYKQQIAYWKKELKKIVLPDIVNTTAINDIFYGHGYLLEYITAHFSNTLVFATEIKKVYCNEETGEKYPMVITALQESLKRAILNSSTYFTKKETNLTVKRKTSLLSSELRTRLKDIDRQLFNTVRSFEILNFINPVNIEQEKRRFYNSRYQVNPAFRYRQIILDPFQFKRTLYQIPVEKIRDINIQLLYKDVISAYTDKIDLLATIGTTKFVYNSLRYFGEPSERDLNNANFLLHSPDVEQEEERIYTVEEARDKFKEEIKSYGFDAKVEIAKNIVSKVLVLNSKKLIRLRRDATFTEKSILALLNHEIGVHMVTTINARTQPLRILQAGLPVNTLTQEGLAIMSEYLSDNLTVFRLKELSMRVLTVKNFINGFDFRQSFEYLMDTGLLNEDAAFYMTARIYRGGGFTKDYLYLKGFRYILSYYNQGNGLEKLLLGKASLSHVDTLNELVERKILLPATYKTRAFTNPVTPNPIMKYLIHAIR
jgi:uncharacterized protein (TIGR02421 family)